MATGTAFKQQCPSCEAMVPVKDINLVGKKIECPKCKDKFIVKSPAAPKKNEDDDEEEPVKDNRKSKSIPGKKPVNAPGQKLDIESDEDAPKKKKKGPLSLGIALAVVGLLVLVTAAYIILFGRSTPDKNLSKGRVFNPPQVQPNITPKNDNGNKKNKEIEPIKPVPVAVATSPATAELTNLLPNDTDHVLHVPLRHLFDPTSPWGDALFQTPDALNNELLRGKLGFSVLAIDDLLRADHYGAGAWTYSVVHLNEIVDQDAVRKALDLKPAPLVKSNTYYQVARPNPWLDILAHVAVGVPRPLGAAVTDVKRPMFVHFYNSQTMIFADEAPLAALLNENRRFKTMGENPGPWSESAFRSAPYLTIKPALKSVLEHMETIAADSKEKILASSATDIEAARLTSAHPEGAGRFLLQPGQLWNITLLLQEHNPRLRTLGTALLQKEPHFFQIRNELDCPVANDAQDLESVLSWELAPVVARFLNRLLGHKVTLPSKEEPVEPLPKQPFVRPKGPPFVRPNSPKLEKEKKEEPAGSRITVTQKDKTVDFVLNLKLEQPEVSKLHTIASLMSCGLRGQMTAAADTMLRFELATAAKLLPEKGLTERGVSPGRYPPGAFERPANTGKRYSREPKERVSWMAGLLPFLGHDTLYRSINFNDSWRDPANWLPAGTLVPQFLDPTYPASTHFLARPDLPFDAAATHFVGIAGVGLDAADYDPTDPANITRRGVMSYDYGMSLDELRQGHGLSSTMVMIQVPPDSPAGVSPWMAGGGSTLRGVPEKNSAAPFVFSMPGKNGAIRRGTYAVMADGSLRYIDQNVSDEVFQAMATAKRPMPENYDPNGPDSLTPLILPPRTSKPKKTDPVKKSTPAPKPADPLKKLPPPKSANPPMKTSFKAPPVAPDAPRLFSRRNHFSLVLHGSHTFAL